MAQIDVPVIVGPTAAWTQMRYHPVQQALIRTTRRFCTIPAGRRSGKTAMAKRKLVMAAMMGTPFPNPAFFAAAPTRDQAQRIFWNDLKAMVPDWMRSKPDSESHMMIHLINGASISVVGLDKPQRVEGSPWDGGVITEFGNTKPTAWAQNIRPVMSDRNGWCWLEGVPEGRNHYYDLHEYALADMLNPDGEWGAYHWTSEDILPPHEIAAAKRDLDPQTYDQEMRASFINFQGRAYYDFDHSTHANARLGYEPRQPLIFCFDFNVSPGIAVVCQELRLPNGLEGTAIIGEVWIPRNSNTPAVCRKLIEDWGDHEGRIMLYGDATGGARGSAKVLGSDWTLIEQAMHGHYGEPRVFTEVPRANPAERSRVNALNSRIRNGAGEVRLMVDPGRAPQVVKDFEGTTVLEGGSGEIDKKHDPMRSHMTDAVGYYVRRVFPVDSDRPTTIKTTGH